MGTEVSAEAPGGGYAAAAPPLQRAPGGPRPAAVGAAVGAAGGGAKQFNQFDQELTQEEKQRRRRERRNERRRELRALKRAAREAEALVGLGAAAAGAASQGTKRMANGAPKPAASAKTYSGFVPQSHGSSNITPWRPCFKSSPVLT